jgi:aspartate aminotransferase
MPRKLADRLSSVAPSATLAMAAKAAKLRAEGHKVYAFSVGEPDFDTPAHIREAAKAALDAGATRYTPVTGTAELKSAICAATERYRGWRPLPSQVTVSCGAKHAATPSRCGSWGPRRAWWRRPRRRASSSRRGRSRRR